MAHDTLSCLNVVEIGTMHLQVILLQEGGSQALRQTCLDASVDRWVSWAGWPRVVTVSSGTHHQGIFSRRLAQR